MGRKRSGVVRAREGRRGCMMGLLCKEPGAMGLGDG